ncbi:MAG: type IV pili twitching motility protein PilT, partial [Anaerotignum sp.]|nr:type IV pili twitching motility protein PilT [Anaerotignum sp.]
MANLMEYLQQAVSHEASDLFLVAGGAANEKVDGHIRPLDGERLLPPETEQLVSEIYRLANRPMAHFMETGDDDFSFSVAGLARFRVNAYRQRGSMAAVIRIVSFDIPHWQELGIPAGVMDLADTQNGMVLVTG